MVNSMGYQQAADANNIILIFPIALIDPVAITIGCMDVVGTTSIGSLNYCKFSSHSVSYDCLLFLIKYFINE